jgi:hypothetical protein
VDLNTLQKIVLINGLNNAVGLLVSSDLAYTYISEQSGGGASRGILCKVEFPW